MVTNRTFKFTDADWALIEKLRKRLERAQGKTSIIAVIRFALREAAAK